jgi:hypothetical protein
MSGTEDAGKEMSVVLCYELGLFVLKEATLETVEHALSSNNTVGIVSPRQYEICNPQILTSKILD